MVKEMEALAVQVAQETGKSVPVCRAALLYTASKLARMLGDTKEAEYGKKRAIQILTAYEAKLDGRQSR